MDLDSALTGKPAEGTSATDLLRADHREVSGLFSQYEQARGAGQTRNVLAQTLVMQLELHDRIEREVFYPAVRERQSARIASALKEHDDITRVADEVRQQADDNVRCDASVAKLKRLVERHVREEEDHLFPRVEAELGAMLSELGARIVKHKETLTRSTESFEGPAT